MSGVEIAVQTNAPQATKEFEKLKDTISRVTEGFSIQPVTDELRKVNTGVAEISKSTASLDKSVNRVTSSIKSMAVALTGALSATFFAKASDSLVQINSRLSTINETTDDVIRQQRRLRKISIDTYSALSDIVDLTVTTVQSMSNINTKSLERFVEVVQKTGHLSGSNAQALSNSLYQLNQALSIGELRGQEFKSISMQMGYYTLALARQLGVTSGELSRMATAGELTTDLLVKTTLAMGDLVDKEYDRLGYTVMYAFKRIGAAAEYGIGDLMQAFRISDALAKTFTQIAIRIETIGDTGFADIHNRVNRVKRAISELKKFTGPSLSETLRSPGQIGSDIISSRVDRWATQLQTRANLSSRDIGVDYSKIHFDWAQYFFYDPIDYVWSEIRYRMGDVLRRGVEFSARDRGYAMGRLLAEEIYRGLDTLVVLYRNNRNLLLLARFWVQDVKFSLKVLKAQLGGLGQGLLDGLLGGSIALPSADELLGWVSKLGSRLGDVLVAAVQRMWQLLAKVDYNTILSGLLAATVSFAKALAGSIGAGLKESVVLPEIDVSGNLRKVADNFTERWKDAWLSAKNYTLQMLNRVEGAARSKLGGVLKYIHAFGEKVKYIFWSAYDEVVGHSYWPDLIDGVVNYTDRLFKAETKVLSFGDKVSDAFANLLSRVKLSRLFEGLNTDAFKASARSLALNIVTLIIGALAFRLGNAKVKTYVVSTVVTSLSASLGAVSPAMTSKVAEFAGDFAYSLGAHFFSGFQNLIQNLSKAVPAVLKGLLSALPSGIGEVMSLVSGIPSWFLGKIDFASVAAGFFVIARSIGTLTSALGLGDKAAERGFIGKFLLGDDKNRGYFSEIAKALTGGTFVNPFSGSGDVFVNKDAAKGAGMLFAAAFFDGVNATTAITAAIPALINALFGDAGSLKIYQGIGDKVASLIKPMGAAIWSKVDKLGDDAARGATSTGRNLFGTIVDGLSTPKQKQPTYFQRLATNREHFISGAIDFDAYFETQRLKMAWDGKVRPVLDSISKGFRDTWSNMLKGFKFGGIKSALVDAGIGLVRSFSDVGKTLRAVLRGPVNQSFTLMGARINSLVTLLNRLIATMAVALLASLMFSKSAKADDMLPSAVDDERLEKSATNWLAWGVAALGGLALATKGLSLFGSAAKEHQRVLKEALDPTLMAGIREKAEAHSLSTSPYLAEKRAYDRETDRHFKRTGDAAQKAQRDIAAKSLFGPQIALAHAEAKAEADKALAAYRGNIAAQNKLTDSLKNRLSSVWKDATAATKRYFDLLKIQAATVLTGVDAPFKRAAKSFGSDLSRVIGRVGAEVTVRGISDKGLTAGLSKLSANIGLMAGHLMGSRRTTGDKKSSEKPIPNGKASWNRWLAGAAFSLVSFKTAAESTFKSTEKSLVDSAGSWMKWALGLVGAFTIVSSGLKVMANVGGRLREIEKGLLSDNLARYQTDKYHEILRESPLMREMYKFDRKTRKLQKKGVDVSGRQAQREARFGQHESLLRSDAMARASAARNSHKAELELERDNLGAMIKEAAKKRWDAFKEASKERWGAFKESARILSDRIKTDGFKKVAQDIWGSLTAGAGGRGVLGNLATGLGGILGAPFRQGGDRLRSFAGGLATLGIGLKDALLGLNHLPSRIGKAGAAAAKATFTVANLKMAIGGLAKITGSMIMLLPNLIGSMLGVSGWFVVGAGAIGAIGVMLFGKGNNLSERFAWAKDKIRGLMGKDPLSDYERGQQLKDLFKTTRIGELEFNVKDNLDAVDFKGMTARQYEIYKEFGGNIRSGLSDIESTYLKTGHIAEEQRRELAKLQQDTITAVKRMPSKDKTDPFENLNRGEELLAKYIGTPLKEGGYFFAKDRGAVKPMSEESIREAKREAAEPGVFSKTLSWSLKMLEPLTFAIKDVATRGKYSKEAYAREKLGDVNDPLVHGLASLKSANLVLQNYSDRLDKESRKVLATTTRDLTEYLDAVVGLRGKDGALHSSEITEILRLIDRINAAYDGIVPTMKKIDAAGELQASSDKAAAEFKRAFNIEAPAGYLSKAIQDEMNALVNRRQHFQTESLTAITEGEKATLSAQDRALDEKAAQLVERFTIPVTLKGLVDQVSKTAGLEVDEITKAMTRGLGEDIQKQLERVSKAESAWQGLTVGSADYKEKYADYLTEVDALRRTASVLRTDLEGVNQLFGEMGLEALTAERYLGLSSDSLDRITITAAEWRAAQEAVQRAVKLDAPLSELHEAMRKAIALGKDLKGLLSDIGRESLAGLYKESTDVIAAYAATQGTDLLAAGKNIGKATQLYAKRVALDEAFSAVKAAQVGVIPTEQEAAAINFLTAQKNANEKALDALLSTKSGGEKAAATLGESLSAFEALGAKLPMEVFGKLAVSMRAGVAQIGSAAQNIQGQLDKLGPSAAGSALFERLVAARDALAEQASKIVSQVKIYIGDDLKSIIGDAATLTGELLDRFAALSGEENALGILKRGAFDLSKDSDREAFLAILKRENELLRERNHLQELSNLTIENQAAAVSALADVSLDPKALYWLPDRAEWVSGLLKLKKERDDILEGGAGDLQDVLSRIDTETFKAKLLGVAKDFGVKLKDAVKGGFKGQLEGFREVFKDWDLSESNLMHLPDALRTGVAKEGVQQSAFREAMLSGNVTQGQLEAFRKGAYTDLGELLERPAKGLDKSGQGVVKGSDLQRLDARGSSTALAAYLAMPDRLLHLPGLESGGWAAATTKQLVTLDKLTEKYLTKRGEADLLSGDKRILALAEADKLQEDAAALTAKLNEIPGMIRSGVESFVDSLSSTISDAFKGLISGERDEDKSAIHTFATRLADGFADTVLTTFSERVTQVFLERSGLDNIFEQAAHSFFDFLGVGVKDGLDEAAQNLAGGDSKNIAQDIFGDTGQERLGALLQGQWISTFGDGSLFTITLEGLREAIGQLFEVSDTILRPETPLDAEVGEIPEISETPVEDAFEEVPGFLQGLFGESGLFSSLGKQLFGEGGIFGDILGGLGKMLPSLLGGAGGGGGGLLGTALKFLAFNSGGHVSGPGTGTSDSIPALLSDGEFVVRAKQTKKYLPLLRAINAGHRISGFANGGLVSASEMQGLAPVLYEEPDDQAREVSNSQVINVNITGDISRQTKSEIYKMLPQIAAGVNRENKERNHVL